MELKAYQTRVLEELGSFSDELANKKTDWQNQLDGLGNVDKEIYLAVQGIDFVEKAWELSKKLPYYASKDGLGNPLPDVYLKVPTGGGKTLLACHAIDHIHRKYLHRKTGLLVWIVPTDQIYRQTLLHLRDRSHPYRQVLEVSSGGRVKIVERKSGFIPADIRDTLTILLLMLPAANRKKQEASAYVRRFGRL